MKMILALLALSGVAASVPAYADKICLDTRKMVSSESKDGHTMKFQMRDGSTYVNHLRGYCPDLKFTGFVWTLQSGDTNVCENENSFRVLESGQICSLGKFEPATAKPVQWDANRVQAPQ